MAVFPPVYLWGFLLLGVGISIPFSINLCGEVLLVGAAIHIGFAVFGMVVVISVLGAAYSLYFFGCLFHGGVREMFVVYQVRGLRLFLLSSHVICSFLRVLLCDFFFLGCL